MLAGGHPCSDITAGGNIGNTVLLVMMLERHTGIISVHSRAVGVCVCAVVLLQGLVYPLDTVRTRLAVCSSTEYAGIWATASKLWRTEGFSAFYRGIVPSTVRGG
jgi:hypothetical protein